MWDDSKYIAFDFETSGTLPEYALQPWRVAQHKAWVTSLATARKIPNKLVIEGGITVGRPTPYLLCMIDGFLNDAIEHNLTVVGWNVAFDISWLLAYGFESKVNQLKFLDGMLLWRHLTVEPEYDTVRHKKRSYGLKAAVAEILPQFAGYESEVDFHAVDAESLLKLQKYNEQDTMFTLRLTRHFYNELAKDPQRLKAALIEADCLPMVAKANLEGMLVDVDTTEALGNRLVQVAADMLTRLAPHGVTEKVVRSPKQLSKLMFEDWGLPVFKQNVSAKTGNITDSTDKEVLHELSFVDPRAAEIRLYREALGNKTKFVDAPLKSVDYNADGRTHPLAMVFGTYTSRMTYASKQGRNKDERQIGFALHQMKRGKDFRSIIAAPPGYTLMEFDAAGQEFRWMAIASGDETMLELCLPGEDPHGFMGARIRHMDYRELVAKVKAGDKDAKDGRQLGKVANLSLQYRTSAKKLRSVARVQYNIPMEQPEADLIYGTYQSTYTKVPTYWKNQIALTKQLGYVETFAGRRVQVVGNWRGSQGWSMESTSINYRIQGTGGDQKYLALSVLRPYINRIGAVFAWELHDGVYFYVPDAMVERAATEIPYLLANLPYKKAWGFTPPIPLPWDCKYGKSWGELKEWDK
jgi:DNA polymerase-1